MFQWNDSYAIGIEYLDRQHQELFSKVNHFTRQVQAQVSFQELMTFADFLKHYTMTHIHDEEELMRDVNFPAADEHAALHIDLIDKCIDLRMALVLEDRDMLEGILDFLENWLVEHIVAVDSRIAHHLIRTQRGSAPG